MFFFPPSHNRANIKIRLFTFIFQAFSLQNIIIISNVLQFSAVSQKNINTAFLFKKIELQKCKAIYDSLK